MREAEEDMFVLSKEEGMFVSSSSVCSSFVGCVSSWEGREQVGGKQDKQ
jgi:hypothetical protein